MEIQKVLQKNNFDKCKVLNNGVQTFKFKGAKF